MPQVDVGRANLALQEGFEEDRPNSTPIGYCPRRYQTAECDDSQRNRAV